MTVRSFDPFTCLVWNEIRSNQAGATGIFKIACETFHAVMVDEVPIAHHQRDSPGVGHGFDGFEHVRDFLAVVNGDLRSRLDDGTIHNRIGIRQTNLDGIDAMLNHGAECFQRIVRIRESIWKITDECRLVRRFEFIEHGFRRTRLMADAERLPGRRGCCCVRHNGCSFFHSPSALLPWAPLASSALACSSVR